MRYFFDLTGSGTTTVDDEGTELQTSEQAKREAAKILAEIAFHHSERAGEWPLELSCAVRDARNLVLSMHLLIEESRLVQREAGRAAAKSPGDSANED